VWVSVHMWVCTISSCSTADVRPRPWQPQEPPVVAFAPARQVVCLPVELPRGSITRGDAVAQREHGIVLWGSRRSTTAAAAATAAAATASALVRLLG